MKKLKVAGDTMIFGFSGGRKDATVLMDSADTKPTLGRYEIVKEAGSRRDGYGYLGKDPKINREVAIKTCGTRRLMKKKLFRSQKSGFSVKPKQPGNFPIPIS